jgi:integrase/recombinase XerD
MARIAQDPEVAHAPAVLIGNCDILGHVDLSTTEIYARASTEAKRKALEAAYTDIVTDNLPEWNQDPGLLSWLARL